MYTEFFRCEPTRTENSPVSRKTKAIRTYGQFFAKLQLICTSSAKRLRWLPAQFGLRDH